MAKKKVEILQVGHQDWSEGVEVPEGVVWTFVTPDDLEQFYNGLKATALEKMIKETQSRAAELKIETVKMPTMSDVRINFSGLMITSDIAEEQLEILDDSIDAHLVFYDSSLNLQKTQKGFLRRKVARRLTPDKDLSRTIQMLGLNLYSGQYGHKLAISDIDVVPNFDGDIVYNGNVNLILSGEFGEEFQPLYTYRHNVPAAPIGVEIWPEYQKEGDVEIQFCIDKFYSGALTEIKETKLLSEKQLRQPYVFKPDTKISGFNITVFAKGKGTLSVGNLHWRHSRMGIGQFIAGGKRFADEKRQEFISFFHPGDMKPPLNVYFSGFRGAEGFEGFFMMKNMGAPFVLIGDPRLEGGCFYMGTDSYEQGIKKTIQSALDYLGFDETQLVLSGLSMGTYGALYYGADFDPHAIVIGKPFTNVGDVADNMHLKRPDEFETSADMLANIIGDTSDDGIAALNQKFCTKFEKGKFSNTSFAIAYMKNDDYDVNAYPRLIDYMADKEMHIYGKGYVGRHNDNSPAVTRWFLNQYYKIMREDFGREL